MTTSSSTRCLAIVVISIVFLSTCATDDRSADDESGGPVGEPATAVAIEVASTGGYAEYAGLTGGRGHEGFVVTSADDDGPGTYRDALSKGDRYIRFDPALDGATIELRSPVVAAGSNVTVDGSGVDVTITRDATRFTGTNIVVAGLRFSDMDADGDTDALTFRDPKSTQVFGVYGNVFEAATDGLVDVIWNNGNDVFGTICGNVFRHHDKAMLIHSGSDEDEGGTYHITLCRNHWLDIYQRTPLSRDAKVHQYNDVFESYGKSDGRGGGSRASRGSEHLLENNVAIPRSVGERTWADDTVTSPRNEFAGPGSRGRVRASNNLLVTVDDITATVKDGRGDDVFAPPYEYDLISASPELRDGVVATAGTCEPAGAEAVNPCAPSLLLEPGEPLRVLVDSSVREVKLDVDGVTIEDADRDGTVRDFALHREVGPGVYPVHAIGVTADGAIESSVVQVAVLGD